MWSHWCKRCSVAPLVVKNSLTYVQMCVRQDCDKLVWLCLKFAWAEKSTNKLNVLKNAMQKTKRVTRLFQRLSSCLFTPQDDDWTWCLSKQENWIAVRTLFNLLENINQWGRKWEKNPCFYKMNNLTNQDFLISGIFGVFHICSNLFLFPSLSWGVSFVPTVLSHHIKGNGNNLST